MLLAIDIGNSHTVLGLFNGLNLVHDWRIQTDRNATSDEITAKIFSLFFMNQVSKDAITGAIIASVVPQLQSSWVSFARSLTPKPMLVDDKIDAGMKILTDHPAEVGADRIVNAAAGFHKYSCPLIIVDFGTAITLDCVSKDGDYLGGAIAPGVAISLDALGKQTAKLPRVNISSPPPNPIGTDTITAIQSGVLYGYGGLIEGLVAQIKKQYNKPEPMVIATGGMASLIAPYAPSIEKIEPILTLEGLVLLHERNR